MLPIEVSTFQDYQFHEVDENNLAKIGRRWFGERFDIENEKSFSFTFPNMVTTEPVKVKVLAAAVSEATATNMQVLLNGSLVSTMNFNLVDDPILAFSSSYQDEVVLSSSEVSIDLIYNNNGNPSAYGYLDYISVEATRNLAFEGSQMVFKNNEVVMNSGIAQYTISNTNNVQEIWDITNKYDVSSVLNSDGNQTMTFKDVAGTNKKYVTVTSLDYFQPLRDANTTVSNQNIKGTIFLNDQGVFEDVDYIIIARNNYVSQAERLAQINRDKYNLNVKVITLNAIYNEFSSR